MSYDDLVTAMRDSFADVHSATPVEQIVSRGRAVRARQRIPRTAVALAVVTAVTAGLLTWLPGPGGTHARTGPAVRTAAYVLDRAAQAAARSRQPVPRPGQYAVVMSVNTSMTEDMGPGGPTRAWLTVDRRRVWQSASGLRPGVAWIDNLRHERLPWSGQPPAAGLGASWQPVPALACPGAPPPRGTYEFLTTLPTSPAKLRAWIYGHKNGGQSADDQAWTDITDLIAGMLVPPRLTAALFKVAATIPGATVIRHATDAAGRVGIAVARIAQGSKEDSELIFDTRTYRLLGERTTLTVPAKGVGPAGTVTGASALLTEKVVSHLPRFPHNQGRSLSDPASGC
jgi:hypothetical protein